MLEELKKRVCDANKELERQGLVKYTWGNVSGIDRRNGLVVIKPSGIPYCRLSPDDMVVIELESGKRVEGKWNPSSDTQTHLELYKAFQTVGGIAHTHSVNAVAFAQAGCDIKALGTTHADYFYGSIPCTRQLLRDEVERDYEKNTGRVIVECFQRRKLNAEYVPGVIVHSHGPFSWGEEPEDSVYHAVVLETVAEMCLKTLILNQDAALPSFILEKHFLRKHGENAYYGQTIGKGEIEG